MLILFVVIPLAAGAIGVREQREALANWYPLLHQPAWTPRMATFPVVWTALYVMMGVAAWLVWRRVGFERGEVALILFFIQLALNAGWASIFFGLRMPGAAFFELLVMTAAVAATTVEFWRATKLAGGLMLPYLGWSVFCCALNFAFWRMN